MIADTKTTAHRPNGFTAPIGGAEVRRQLHLSLGLVVMLSIGIVSAGVAVGGHPLAVKQDMAASRLPVTVMQAETAVTGAKRI